MKSGPIPTSAGSSPRAGRRPVRPRRHRRRGGLIPASGETTPATRGGRPRGTAHPRERGDDPFVLDVIDGEEGSSPRAGRRLELLGDPLRPARLIPASGETTPCSLTRRSTRAAHPRERGDDATVSTPSLASAGSSPRAGRRPAHRGGLRDHGGLIPASGETTTRTCSARAAPPAHPRERGDDRRRDGSTVIDRGSSPRAGRRRRRTVGRRRRLRLIPASGETTAPGPGVTGRGWAHPRERGDDAAARGARGRPPGSSPRAGRRRTKVQATRCWAGLIPASGETTSGHRLRP